MKDSLKTHRNKVQALKDIVMARLMSDSTGKTGQMAKDSTSGPTETTTKVSSSTI